ncbi:hypothetical protein [Rhizobium paknamense]|uniref:Uncharacterized protein n=1 Tax=Rhizobium paknamense TaxID=1206817 RepID=A0ABU0IA82_9HYPH|nr:hypothetical protein [Rhizobium paknamense]MDQ0454134.1 hypothetical protein [Rhizobium paknamense]
MHRPQDRFRQCRMTGHALTAVPSLMVMCLRFRQARGGLER